MKKVIAIILLFCGCGPAMAQSISGPAVKTNYDSLWQYQRFNVIKTFYLPPVVTNVPSQGGALRYNSGVVEVYNGSAWVPLSSSTTAWNLTGNAGTNPATNFIGTTDAKPLNFRVNNTPSGVIDNSNFNLALGYYALPNGISTGGSNTAIGAFAGFQITGGSNNVALGNAALVATSTGTNNMAIGNSALGSNNTGNYNVGVGTNAGTGVLGDGNTAVGSGALYNSQGNYNTGLGYNAGYNLVTGDSNILIGYNVQPPLSNNAGNQLSIGNGSYTYIRAFNNQLYLDRANVIAANVFSSPTVQATSKMLSNSIAPYSNGSILTLGSITPGSRYTPGTYTNQILTSSTGSTIATVTVGGGGGVTSVGVSAPAGLNFNINDTVRWPSGPGGSGFYVLATSVTNGITFTNTAQTLVNARMFNTGDWVFNGKNNIAPADTAQFGVNFLRSLKVDSLLVQNLQTGSSGDSVLVASAGPFAGTNLVKKVAYTGGIVKGGTITWPGAVYNSPTVGSVNPTDGSLNFLPSLVTQTANTVFASPSSGSGTPSFRSLVAADLPFTFVDSTNKTYREVVTFTGTQAPTGTPNLTYNAIVIGNHVSLKINLNYSSPGVGITAIVLPLPSWMPSAVVPAGFASSGPVANVKFFTFTAAGAYNQALMNGQLSSGTTPQKLQLFCTSQALLQLSVECDYFTN